MARRMADGELETAWFERHRSTPIMELPAHWPADYRDVVEQRIALIETDANIGLIERPEFKRRWSSESVGGNGADRAAHTGCWTEWRRPPSGLAATSRLLSTNQLTDLLRRDVDFLSVAALYAGRRT